MQPKPFPNPAVCSVEKYLSLLPDAVNDLAPLAQQQSEAVRHYGNWETKCVALISAKLWLTLQQIKLLTRHWRPSTRKWSVFLKLKISKPCAWQPMVYLEHWKNLSSRGDPFPTAICSSGFIHSDTVSILKEFGKVLPSIPSTVTHCELENNCNAFRSKPIEYFDPVSVAELGNAMSELKLDQTPDPDGYPAAWLNLSHPVIQPYLLSLFNACIATGYFPETWHSAKVTILRLEHKSSYDVTSSYRPISILCALSNVFGNVLHSRLNRLSLKEAWINDNKHGFRVGRSTESAGLTLAKLIEHGNQGRLFTAYAFLDI